MNNNDFLNVMKNDNSIQWILFVFKISLQKKFELDNNQYGLVMI